MSDMDQYFALQHAFTVMQQQDALYQPSAFWASASQQIALAVQQHGIENFRAIPEILSYFVPTYGCPGNSFTIEMQQALTNYFKTTFPDAIKAQTSIDLWLNGYQAALADYRVFLASAGKSESLNLQLFSESDYGNPIEQFNFAGKQFSRSSLNYLLGLSLLQQHIDEDIHTVLEIGGGFGTLGEILGKCSTIDMRYIDIDIPPTSFVAEHYLRAALPSHNVSGFMQTQDIQVIDIETLPAISVLASWQLQKLVGSVDLFVNFISFQEMEPHIVQNYLNHVDRLRTKWILLRNIKEGKQIKKSKDDIGVEQPILGDDYISMLPNYQLITRQVHPFGFKTVDNFHSELFLFKRN